MKKNHRFVVVTVFLSLFNLAAPAFADNPPVPAGEPAVAAPAVAGDAASATAPGQPPAPGIASMAMPFLLMFAVLYFLMIRPQQKKMKEHAALLNGLQHGDEVVTSSGILGKVTGITDKVVTVEIAQDVRVKMLKNQVSTVLKGQVKELA